MEWGGGMEFNGNFHRCLEKVWAVCAHSFISKFDTNTAYRKMYFTQTHVHTNGTRTQQRVQHSIVRISLRGACSVKYTARCIGES